MKRGPKRSNHGAVGFDRRLIPDPEQWLVERFGPVKVTFLDAAAPMAQKARRKAAKASPDAVLVHAPAFIPAPA